MPASEGEPGGPDEFERRLREITSEFISGPGVIREPSAAERARQAAPRTGRRATRKARKLRKPVASPGQRPSRRPRSPARRRIRPWVVTVVVVACVAGATVAISRLAGHTPNAAADNRPVTNGPTPATSASLPTPTLTAPFLGTPAQSFADGAAGIVVPPAHAVGPYSAAQVARAYKITRNMLIAAHLDPVTLRGGSPDAFTSLLIPEQRKEIVAGLDKIGLDSRGNQKSTRALVTSFAPGSTQLVGNVIKVHGAMRATTGLYGSWHVLRIHADYLFVYPVERPGQPFTLMRVVRRDRVYVEFASYTDPGGPLEPWWDPHGSGDAGARCDVNDGFVHPQFSNGPPDKVKPTGTPVNPYDLGVAVTTNRCQRTTGT